MSERLEIFITKKLQQRRREEEQEGGVVGRWSFQEQMIVG